MPHGTYDFECPHLTSEDDDRFASEIHNETSMGFKYFSFDNVNEIGINYRSGARLPNGKVYIKLGEDTVGEITVNGAENWTWEYTKVEAQNGTYPVYFVYEGEGTIDIKDISFR